MKLLLDTHIFAWYITSDAQSAKNLDAAIADADNEIFLSVAAVWEASIKYHLGKWPLPQPPEVLFPAQRGRHGITSLPVTEGCVAEMARLPLLHRDPFDRIMIGQAIHYGLSLVTMDAAIRAYPMAPIFVP